MYGKLPTPKKKNYKFKGWYTKKKGGTKITAKTVVAKSKKHTIYAQWVGPKGKGKTITKKEYKRIKNNMSYSDVKYIVGGKGKLTYKTSYKDDGKKYTLKNYTWKKKNGGVITVSFDDNKSYSKTIWK